MPAADCGAARLAEADHAVAGPAPGLQGLVHRYTGYRYVGMAPGIHRGLPVPYLAMIVSFGPPTRLIAMPEPSQPPGSFIGLVGGFHTRPAVISHDGHLAGVQIDLTPAGMRSLLGLPCGELGPLVVHLEDVMGAVARELIERVGSASNWSSRFAVLDTLLLRRAERRPPAEGPLSHAWNHVVASGGTMPVDRIAAQVGWCRRQLGERFRREYGVSVKEAARVVRFHHSRTALQMRPGRPIGEVAAATGYYDQAHMAREWRQLAGCSPSTWFDTEDLPFIQDDTAVRAAH